MAALKVLHVLALALWVGGVVFFSLVAAPSLFGALPRADAGRAVSAIFPRYYAFGAACGVAALVTGLLLGWWRAAQGRGLVAELILVTLMLGCVVYSRQVVLPRATRARADRPAAADAPGAGEREARFASLHRLSVMLNGAVLLMGIAALALAVLHRPPPPRLFDGWPG